MAVCVSVSVVVGAVVAPGSLDRRWSVKAIHVGLQG